MNCTECKELLVEYIEGLLDESQKQAVSEHLNSCRTCQAEIEQLTSLHDRLVNNGKNVSQNKLEDKVMDNIVREQNVRLKAADKAGSALKLRSIIMKSPMTKIAIAAVIIIAVLIGINPFGSTITFADVIEPILNAKTVILDLIVGSDESGPTMHEIVVDQRIRRTMSNMPTLVQILDFESGEMLVLENEGNTATYADIKGYIQEGTQNYVEFLRQVITKVQEGQVEKIGEKVIDGQKVIGFVGRGPNEEVTIWADPETAHPIRIELELGQMYSIMKNLEFDAQVDPALVSMEIPAGYQLQNNSLDLTGATEEDLIETLRIWAEIIGDGIFPESVDSQNVIAEVPVLIEKLKGMNIPAEEGTEIGINFGRGMIFHQIINTQGTWHYAGEGVKFGDADTPIFWYQMEGSPTYRVIYGDLHVEDVKPENLPK